MYICEIETRFGTVQVLSDDEGIRRINLPGAVYDGETTPGDPHGASDQLRAYFLGKRRTFDLPLCLEGTDFQKSCWMAIARIPYGETRLYKEIAEQVGSPKAFRAVGAAMHDNPIPIILPCHRVVSRSGLRGFAGGLDMKAGLLALEGATLG